MTADPPGRITPTRPTPTCPICTRDLEARVEAKVNGRISIALVCARHGSFPHGWRPKFIDATVGEAWVARQRQRQQRFGKR